MLRTLRNDPDRSRPHLATNFTGGISGCPPPQAPVAAADPAGVDRRRAGRAHGRHHPHRPPRRDPAARARLPGRRRARSPRRLPARGRGRAAAAAAERRRSGRGGRGPAGRHRPQRGRVRRGRGGGPGQARAGHAVAPAAPGRRRAHVDAADPGPDGPPVDAATSSWSPRRCRGLERLRFDYVDSNGEATDRLVEPFRLVHVDRRWYLVAFDPSRADWRNFRLDRIGRRAAHRRRASSAPTSPTPSPW